MPRLQSNSGRERRAEAALPRSRVTVSPGRAACSQKRSPESSGARKRVAGFVTLLVHARGHEEEKSSARHEPAASGTLGRAAFRRRPQGRPPAVRPPPQAGIVPGSFPMPRHLATAVGPSVPAERRAGTRGPEVLRGRLRARRFSRRPLLAPARPRPSDRRGSRWQSARPRFEVDRLAPRASRPSRLQPPRSRARAALPPQSAPQPAPGPQRSRLRAPQRAPSLLSANSLDAPGPGRRSVVGPVVLRLAPRAAGHRKFRGCARGRASNLVTGHGLAATRSHRSCGGSGRALGTRPRLGLGAWSPMCSALREGLTQAAREARRSFRQRSGIEKPRQAIRIRKATRSASSQRAIRRDFRTDRNAFLSPLDLLSWSSSYFRYPHESAKSREDKE